MRKILDATSDAAHYRDALERSAVLENGASR